jgi:hypothetical protein
MEFLSQYNYSFHYVAGTLNTAVNDHPHPEHMMIVATFLSQSGSIPPFAPAKMPLLSVAAVLCLDLDNTVLQDIQSAYLSDLFAIKVRESLKHGSSPSGTFEEQDGLLFYKDQIVVPKIAALHK